LKSFYSPAKGASGAHAGDIAETSRGGARAGVGHCDGVALKSRARARVAVYDDPTAAPQVYDVDPRPIEEFIRDLSARIYELCAERGSSIPHTAIREVVENLIHANFAEPVVSILEEGSTIRFADQGPGIPDKERALLPGFTTAHGDMKRYIRGVGSGLPIVREYLLHTGGSIAVEDNLGTGSVVTLRSRRVTDSRMTVQEPTVRAWHIGAAQEETAARVSMPVSEEPVARPRLSARQKQVLALVLESGLAGPSLVAKELGVGVSTAYRDLAMLEEAGLIVSDAGKRTLTPGGLSYLGELTNGS
jgi:hypothetical protein